MLNKIDKIQKELDELIHLCFEAGGAESPEEPLDKFSKLGYLILRLQDGELDEHYSQLLEQWLLSDREALNYYLEFQQLNALLYSYFHPERADQLLEKMKDEMSATNGA